MNERVLVTRGLTKIYSGKAAVDNVNIVINKGDIYGLIGRNGAGKTTLIRLIASLVLPNSGDIEMFGESSESGLTKARARMGAVVENPAFYPNLTAEQNLEYYRIMYGIPEKSRVQEALEMSGLTDTGKKKFKNFSLGMKQRLGLSLAAMGKPDFIILDEPVNGLDPIGIIEMRETIKRLNREHGITMLVSSHILSELSQMATRYGIIENGKLIKEVTDEELHQKCQRCIAVVVEDIAGATSVIETKLNTTNYKVINGNEIRIYDHIEDPAEISFQLNSNGIRVSSVHEVGDNLEDYFRSIINGQKI